MHIKTPKRSPKPQITKEQLVIDLTPKKDLQDGRIPILLKIPAESLTHITSFLDPPSLFAISLTNKFLRDHVNDDNTWRKAFENQILGASPEDESINRDHTLFRRTEATWRKEYVDRYNILRRWEKCRNPTVSHTPHYSIVTSMHLLTEQPNGPAVLSTSLQYGVVARSLPLTGKVLKGYLNASGTANGFGIGNPNVEFNPDVSICAVTGDGGTAKIIWGHTHGEVGVTIASRVMDSSRSSVKLLRSQIDDQHLGVLTTVIWLEGGNTFVTAATDGYVKVWDVKRMRCLWASEGVHGGTNYCLKLSADSRLGILVAAMRSGEVYVWTGLTSIFSENSGQSSTEISTVLVTPPWEPNLSLSDVPEIVEMILNTESSAMNTNLAVLYADQSRIHTLSINTVAKSWQWQKLDDGPLGPIHCLCPFAGSKSVYSSLLAGDNMGRVTHFEWVSSSEQSDASSVKGAFHRKVDAVENGAVTCLAINAYILAVGSSRGAVFIINPLNFQLIRTFPASLMKSPIPNSSISVRNILLERDLLVVSAGSRVMAWKATAVKEGKGVGRMKRTATGKRFGQAKGFQQIELLQDIKESKSLLEHERRSYQQVLQREREQLSALNNLGLDETEALDYALMLSRDDQKPALKNHADLHCADGELFEEDLFNYDANAYNQGSRKTESVRVANHHYNRNLDTAASSSYSSDTSEYLQDTFTSSQEEFNSASYTGNATVYSQRHSQSCPSRFSGTVNDTRSEHAEYTLGQRSVEVDFSMEDVDKGGGISQAVSGSPDDLQYAIELSLAESLSRQGIR